jgi:hypothetical protein
MMGVSSGCGKVKLRELLEETAMAGVKKKRAAEGS